MRVVIDRLDYRDLEAIVDDFLSPISVEIVDGEPKVVDIPSASEIVDAILKQLDIEIP